MEASGYEATVNNELVDFAQQLSAQKSSLENVRSAALEVYNSEIDLMVKQYTKTVNSIKAATSAKVPTSSLEYRQLLRTGIRRCLFTVKLVHSTNCSSMRIEILCNNINKYF